MKKEQIKNLALTAMFLALGLVLPMVTGHLQQMGNMLLPMHLPVFLCALVCGWQYSLPMAFILPVLRSLLFGMPPMYPTALAMAFELATYAFVAGFIYFTIKKQSVLTLYISLVSSMVSGRIVWGIASLILLGIKGSSFTFSAFLSGAVLNAVPGIILQLVLIPALMFALDRTHLLPFKLNKRGNGEKAAEEVQNID